MKRHSSVFPASVFVLFALAWSALAWPLTKGEIDAGVEATMQKFYTQNPTHRELVSKAAGVLVFPRITKAGVGIGGEYGEGALLVDGKIVRHYKVTGASVGATLGVAARSAVILFMTTDARDKFEHSQGWTIGADTAVAVGKGAGHEYDNETLRKPVLSFVLGEHGLMADVSLQGAKVTLLPD